MKVYFFTGAGVSAESGISTFRDSNGLWENNKISEVCNINTWRKNKESVFKFYSERRMQLATVQPNLIHMKISELQKKYGEDNVVIITQNVDDLFERSGCKNVLHLHGNLTKIHCTNKKCNFEKDIGYEEYLDSICPECNQNELKPSIVFFGENAPNYHFMKRYFHFIEPEDIFIIMGTLGNVVPIQLHTDFFDCTKILNNLEESDYIKSSSFDHVFLKPGTEAILDISEIIESKFNENK